MAVTSRTETTTEETSSSVMNRLIEFAQFKGETEGQLSGLTAAIGAVSEGLHRRLDDLGATMNRRFDSQDTEITEIRAQTTKTNGRVTLIEREREKEAAVQAAHADDQQHRDARFERRRGWMVKAVWSVSSLAVGAGLTEFFRLLFGG